MTQLRHSQVSSPRRDVMRVLQRLQYATVAQVAYWLSDRSQSAIYELLSSLEQSGFIVRHKAIQPHIFALTRKGYRLTNAKAPAGSRVESWSVMTHRCHRNLAEIRLREHYQDFQFSTRLDCYRYGLNPGHGEHFGVIEPGQFIFMLLDDYLFESTRISHAWNRTHAPHRIHFERENRVHKWSELATHYVIAVTDAVQYDAHMAYVQKYQLENTAMLKLEAIW